TTKLGDLIPCLVSATSLELSGEPYILAISKDISAQRATEARLRGSEERFRGIFENAPIGIMLVDMQGHIFQANHTAASLLAYDEQHMTGIHVSRLVPPEERASFKETLAAMTRREATHKSERRMVCQNGLEIWTNFHVVLQRSSDGDSLYYIVQIADISDIKQGQQRMEQMAFYDTLTNLANRRLFQDRLHQAIEHSIRTNRASALLFLDLDNFKRVNDTLGHQVGDHLLREVASRLQQCVRKEDTVARTGGDEFTILLTEIGTPSDAALVAQKILNHLREPFTISNHPLIVTTSIGITVVPGDGLDPNLLLRNADLAMYKAKEHGRNNYQFYSQDFNTNAVKHLRTEYELRQALDNDEFELYYQPKISIRTGKIVGVESLIRWNHPERGVLMPDEFITIAEDTGSIIDIGSWIIETACRAGRHLSDHHGRPIQVAINISPRQFRDPNLITTVRRSLRETQLDPQHVEIEITETMLMQDVEAAQTTVNRLAELGVHLAIDDFGTGYSSLNYLKRFPINTVKVDRSFVMDIPANPDDMAITRAVIAMAHQLKMEVVAEGVETIEQFSFLSEHHCEYAQGWLFSKAIPLQQVLDLLPQVLPHQQYIQERNAANS
ncbi:MAG: EAL domain-containing protein, partial [Pseudomonadota bacterium]